MKMILKNFYESQPVDGDTYLHIFSNRLHVSEMKILNDKRN